MKSIDFSENMYYNKTHTDTNMEEIMAVIDKSKALDTALAQIEKQFGKGAVMRLGQEDALEAEDTGPEAVTGAGSGVLLPPVFWNLYSKSRLLFS